MKPRRDRDTGMYLHPVKGSPDLDRILQIPRRPPPDLNGPRGAALVELMNARLRRENAACKCASYGRPCILSLKPTQAWALYEAPQAGGLLGGIGVGEGKTGLDILMAVAMGAKVAVLFIPPGLKEQLLRDYLAWAEHWHVPSLVIGERGFIRPGMPVVHVLPYSKFSRPESTTTMRQLAPDLVIADEGHRLRNKDTATTSRVLTHWRNYPECRLCVWSGTLTTKSILDYVHLSALALGQNSPVPLKPTVAEQWATAIDPSPMPANPGALKALCAKGEAFDAGFNRRLRETRGVVITPESSVRASLTLFEREPPETPEIIRALLKDLRNGWIRPDGEELIDIMAVKATACQLACGFYYRWRFPRGESEELILEWFKRRKAWNRELREKLKRREEHLDSEFLCTKAAIRGEGHVDAEDKGPVWRAEHWAPWAEIKDEVFHETEAVWVDDWLVNDAVEWATKHTGVVWYKFGAVGQRIAKLSGLPLHTGGADAEARILAEKGDTSIIASIKAHGTGRDGLQFLFANQLVVNPPASGGEWEQLLGRLHRVGLTADEVECHVYRHTPEVKESLDKALRQAKYVEGFWGSLQKLLACTATFDLTDAFDDLGY